MVIPGILTFTVYDQNRYSPSFYTFASNQDLLLDESNGAIYQIADSVSNDNGNPIVMEIITKPVDGGTNETKFCSTLELIGDKIPDVAYVSYSDNDYASSGQVRPVNLQVDRSQLRRCGKFRRRSHKIQYVGQYQPRFYGLEMNVEKGTM